jgi:outer membrane protein OmpA-like peptidoglycan-associated protein
MAVKSIFLPLCFCTFLFACNLSNSNRHDTSLFNHTDSDEYFNEDKMQMYIETAQMQLMSLEKKENRLCTSGQLAIAQDYLIRATAEHNAGMEKDAFITLLTLDRQIRKIHCINSYINQNLGCGHTNKKIVLNRWYSEGQFEQCAKSSITKKTSTTRKKEKKNQVVITETLHDFNEDKIKAIYFPSLDKLVNLINNFPQSRLEINGHTDSIGTTEYNKQLSQRRAENVIKYFTNKGIDASQIELKASGEKKIREVEHGDVSRVFNRYTSITLFLDTSDRM